MKPLKKNQLGPKCSFCESKTRAVFRQDGFAGLFCCREHVQNLKTHEEAVRRRESRLTEADYQTWGMF